MKKIMFVALAVSMAFASCSNSSNPAMYYSSFLMGGTQNPSEGTTTSPNNPNPSGDENNGNENGGGQNENGGGGGSSTTSTSNKCDMGCDFDLTYYVDKIYVNGTPAEWSGYGSYSNQILWRDDYHSCGRVHLCIFKNGNELIVKKNPNYDITRLFNILKVEKTSEDRIDITIERVSEN